MSGEAGGHTPGAQRAIRLDPDQPIRMKTSTLVSILAAVAVGVVMWMRLEAVVARQGDHMEQMAEDIKDIKSYFGIREKPANTSKLSP